MDLPRALVPFLIDDAWLAVDAKSVREILGTRPWLPIPGARAELPGVIAWRGKAVAVADVAAVFGRPTLRQDEPRARTLLLEVNAIPLALPVDAVREVLTVADDRFEPVHPPLPISSLRAHLGQHAAAVLDLPKWLHMLVGAHA